MGDPGVRNVEEDVAFRERSKLQVGMPLFTTAHASAYALVCLVTPDHPRKLPVARARM